MDAVVHMIFDEPGYIIIGLLVLNLILLIGFIIVLIKQRKLYRKYDKFMRGKDAETMEESILKEFEKVKGLEAEDLANKDSIKGINRALKGTFQGRGLVKYDAFKGMGGQSSFALTLLDQDKNGFVLNAMHSREGCYLYIKEIKEGEATVLLGKEEKQSLDKALGKE